MASLAFRGVVARRAVDQGERLPSSTQPCPAESLAALVARRSSGLTQRAPAEVSRGVGHARSTPWSRSPADGFQSLAPRRTAKARGIPLTMAADWAHGIEWGFGQAVAVMLARSRGVTRRGRH